MISHVTGNLRFQNTDIAMTEEMLMRLYKYNRACCIPIDDFKFPP